MPPKRRAVTRFALAIFVGTAVYLVAYNLFGYYMGWLSATNLTLWWDQVDMMFYYGVPLFLAGVLAAIATYASVLKPRHDKETRCRKFGYILKGISEPKKLCEKPRLSR